MRLGSEFVATTWDLEDALTTSDVVISGEGRVDDSSMRGKAPGLVWRLAAERGIPCFMIAGSVDDGVAEDIRARSISLDALAGSTSQAMDHAGAFIRQAGVLVGRRLADMRGDDQA